MPLQPRLPLQTDRIKVKFVFSEGARKWSEVHWAPQTGASAMAGVLTTAQSLAVLRADLLANTCNFLRIELSCPNQPRNTMRDASVATFAKRTTQANTAMNTVPVLFAGGNLNRATSFIGGVPDNIIANGIVQTGGGKTWAKDLNTYCTALVNAGWGFMGRARDNTVAPRVPIKAVQNTAPALNVVTVTTRLPHQIGGGAQQFARVGGVAGATKAFPVNQLWNVTVLDANNFTLNGMPNLTQVFQLLSTGWAQNQVIVFHAYTNYVIKDPDTRKRGVRTEDVPAKKKFKRTIGY